jgi:putative DNA primase/helicase
MPATLSPEDCLIKDLEGKITSINTEKASNMLLEMFWIIHFVENNQTFLYNNGVYMTYARSVLRRELYRLFEGIKNKRGRPVINKHTIKEILARVCSLSSISIHAIESSEPILNLVNGILDLTTLELKEHSPKIKMLTQSPVKFDSDAQCPEFMGFMDQAVAPKYRPLIGELIGYILWPEYNIHKAFMLLGPKRTGKGTLTRVIESVIGEYDCAHVGLQDLAGNRFARARLFGMKLNTFADLPVDPIKDPGIFKNLTGEDTIDAENKFEKIFSFKNRAKLLYSANYLPRLKKDDDAFYGRWMIVPFNNSVYGKEDTHLKDKLTTPEELSGILNFGLEGLARLRANGWKFTYEDDAISVYKRKSKPIIAFLEDKCEQSDGYVTKSDLLAANNEYARMMGLPLASSKVAFGKIMMDQTVISVETVWPKVKNKQVEAWSGIRLKETA